LLPTARIPGGLSPPGIGGRRPPFAARSGVGSEAFCGAALHPVDGARSRRVSSYIPRHGVVAATVPRGRMERKTPAAP